MRQTVLLPSGDRLRTRSRGLAKEHGRVDVSSGKPVFAVQMVSTRSRRPSLREAWWFQSYIFVAVHICGKSSGQTLTCFFQACLWGSIAVELSEVCAEHEKRIVLHNYVRLAVGCHTSRISQVGSTSWNEIMTC